ncbi:MAG: PEP-CTERM system histidine kinase PrsK [Gammaproteobacteria bacterium]|nr:PEP-CTERM system histidine kinase PrsK [Gammaproteobacteria bacterium]
MEYITALGLLLIMLLVVITRWKGSRYIVLVILFLIVSLIIYLAIKNWQSLSSNFLSLFIIIFSICMALLAVLWFSFNQRLQSQIKVRLAKTFSLYKYDYRDSWLGFNEALDFAHQEEDFYPQAIKALAQMVGSPGGKLWSLSGNRCHFVDHWDSPLLREETFRLPANLIEFMQKTNWVVDVNEYVKHPQLYRPLRLDLSYFEQGAIKIFVPLRRENELVAIVGLKTLEDTRSLNWEDHDLLKAAGQQMASYLGLYEATSRLYEQREFAAFNRLSAFVVHDLKNVAAQLELITQNASKYGDNPEFIKDSFETVESANQRLGKMLKQLRRKESPDKRVAKTYLPDLVEQLTEQVELQIKSEVPKVYVFGIQEQLVNIIMHLDDNAQQAVQSKNLKPKDAIKHQIEAHDDDLYWHIIDQGIGMSEEFMRDSLFKPFETTKGNAGMGIGVYQCRYLLRGFDGDLIIRSQLGEGTHCTAILSLASETNVGVKNTGDENDSE